MKFKRFTNFFHLIICVIISLIISATFLAFDFSVESSYLLSTAISIAIYILITTIYKKGIATGKSVEATLKNCKYSILSNCNLTYEFMLDGQLKSVVYELGNLETIGKKEKIYVLDDNSTLIRERDLTLFKEKGLEILSFISIILAIAGLYLKSMPLEILESFTHIWLFKFMNIFAIGACLILYSVFVRNKKEYILVEGTIIQSFINENAYTDVNGFQLRSNAYTPRYEYEWNGEKKEYVSTNTSTTLHKIDSKKMLYVDKDGTVIKEKGQDKDLVLFSLILLFFYIIGIISVLG